MLSFSFSQASFVLVDIYLFTNSLLEETRWFSKIKAWQSSFKVFFFFFWVSLLATRFNYCNLQFAICEMLTKVVLIPFFVIVGAS